MQPETITLEITNFYHVNNGNRKRVKVFFVFLPMMKSHTYNEFENAKNTRLLNEDLEQNLVFALTDTAKALKLHSTS